MHWIQVDTLANHLKDPGSILKAPGSAVNSVYLQTNRLRDLQKIVAKHLPPTVSVATYDDNVLQLTLDSAVLATRLRYNNNDLIHALRHHPAFRSLASIRLLVRPTVPNAQATAPETHDDFGISQQSAAHIRATAQYIEDERLRKALTSLADTGTRLATENAENGRQSAAAANTQKATADEQKKGGSD